MTIVKKTKKLMSIVGPPDILEASKTTKISICIFDALYTASGQQLIIQVFLKSTVLYTYTKFKFLSISYIFSELN